jgi:hypothetical protein
MSTAAYNSFMGISLKALQSVLDKSSSSVSTLKKLHSMLKKRIE